MENTAKAESDIPATDHGTEVEQQAEVWKARGAKWLAECQELIDMMKGMPQYAKYVKEMKLSYLDTKLAVYDELLRQGVLK